MKKDKENFIKKVLKKIYNTNKKSENKKANSIPTREPGESIPEEYRLEYLRWCCVQSEKNLEESRANFLKSVRSSKEIDHEKANEAAEERRELEENRRINEELRYIAVELEKIGIKRYSSKRIGDKYIISYGKCKDDSDKVVIEYTRDELIEKSKQREKEQKTQGEE